MTDRHYNFNALKAIQANTICKSLLTDAWHKRLFFEEPTLWLALVLPVAKARAYTACKANTERTLNDFDGQRLANIMQAYAPCIKDGLKTALERGVKTEYEPILDTLLTVWEPFCITKHRGATQALTA